MANKGRIVTLSGNCVLFMRGTKHMPVPWEDVTVEYRAKRGRRRPLAQLCPLVVCGGDAKRELAEYKKSLISYEARGNQDMIDFCTGEAALLQGELDLLFASPSGVYCTLRDDPWTDVVHVEGDLLTRKTVEKAIAVYLLERCGIKNTRFRWKEDKNKDGIRLFTM